MTTESLTLLSNTLAGAVDASAPSVVQVQGRRRPASGLVYSSDVVVTMARVLGRGDVIAVRRHDGHRLDADLVGWDPATGLAVLRAPDLEATPATLATAAPRVGHIALAVARSWSNAVTASVGIVSVIGGPLQTGRRRAIDQIIRTTAPMHDGFAGGAFTDGAGALVGVATAAAIRGLGVVIPASIAWKTTATILEHGQLKRGYLGVAGQPVRLPDGQRGARDNDEAVLVVGVTAGGPASTAGVLIGDIILEVDGHAIASPEDLLDLLVGERVGRGVALRLLRGGRLTDLDVTVGERSAS